MTSVTASLAQIGAGLKFYRSTATTNHYYVDVGPVSALMTDAAFTAATGSTTGTGLYRDLGKQIVTYGTNGMHTAIYRLVQLVDGASTEGNAENFNITATSSAGQFYIQVWNATGSVPTVARV